MSGPSWSYRAEQAIACMQHGWTSGTQALLRDMAHRLDRAVDDDLVAVSAHLLERIEQAQAERDAARAEVRRLRDGLREIERLQWQPATLACLAGELIGAEGAAHSVSSLPGPATPAELSPAGRPAAAPAGALSAPRYEPAESEGGEA